MTIALFQTLKSNIANGKPLHRSSTDLKLYWMLKFHAVCKEISYLCFMPLNVFRFSFVCMFDSQHHFSLSWIFLGMSLAEVSMKLLIPTSFGSQSATIARRAKCSTGSYSKQMWKCTVQWRLSSRKAQYVFLSFFLFRIYVARALMKRIPSKICTFCVVLSD